MNFKPNCTGQEGGSKAEPEKSTEEGKKNVLIFRNCTFVRYVLHLFSPKVKDFHDLND